MIPYPIVGVLTGGVILGFAVWKSWLTPSGVAAAFVTGAALVAGSHAAGPILLVVFFVSSSLMDRVGRSPQIEAQAIGQFTRPRNAGQVFANSVIPALAALLAPAALLPESGSALAGAIAAMTADTWATEIGTGLRAPARLLTSWKPVKPGETGAVSFPGTLAGVVGASAIAIVATLLPAAAWGPAVPTAFAPVAIGGIAGLFTDSLLGATAERRFHVVTNEGVNLVASLTGAAVALALAASTG